MGLEYQDIGALISVFKRKVPRTSGRLLILGDAVLHFDSDKLTDIAKSFDFQLSDVPEVLDVDSLGRALGFSRVETLDVNGKATINLDLQEPLPESMLGQYDLVIDAGVLFWCFDPGLVLKNIYKLTAPGGVIFHITALTGFFGRGYYNIHPRLFEAFYLTNQCEFLQATHRTKHRLNWCGRVIQRLKSRVGLESKTSNVSKNEIPGSVYLARASQERIEFKHVFSAPEAELIPNNVVSTFAFRKLTADEPSTPLLIC